MAYNKQYASAYVLYMIIGSEFNHCSFANPMMEGRLRLEYTEMKSNDQIRLEEGIIDKLSGLNIPEDSDCIVRTGDDNGQMMLSFDTQHGRLATYVATDGKYRICTFQEKPARKQTCSHK